MYRHILVSLLETIVFLDVMQVIASNYHSSLHLHLNYSSSQDTASNGDVAGERAFLVDVRAFNRLIKQFNCIST